MVHESQDLYPGQSICKLQAHVELGDNVYQEWSYYKASIIGNLLLETTEGKTKVSVKALSETSDKFGISSLKLRDELLCCVKRIESNRAKLKVLAVNNKYIGIPLTVILKKEYMRAEDIDSIEMEEIMMTGDLLKTRI